MSDISPELFQIQQEETAPQAAVSESTMSKVGASNNFNNLFRLPVIEFRVNGPYNLIPLPNIAFDGIRHYPFAWEIGGVAIESGTSNGTSGTLELDIKWQPYDNSAPYVSIFSTTPKFDAATVTANDSCYNGDVKTGFTAPVLAKTQFNAKDKLRMDILQTPSVGDVDACGLVIFIKPRNT